MDEVAATVETLASPYLIGLNFALGSPAILGS